MNSFSGVTSEKYQCFITSFLNNTFYRFDMSYFMRAGIFQICLNRSDLGC